MSEGIYTYSPLLADLIIQISSSEVVSADADAQLCNYHGFEEAKLLRFILRFIFFSNQKVTTKN